MDDETIEQIVEVKKEIGEVRTELTEYEAEHEANPDAHALAIASQEPGKENAEAAEVAAEVAATAAVVSVEAEQDATNAAQVSTDAAEVAVVGAVAAAEPPAPEVIPSADLSAADTAALEAELKRRQPVVAEPEQPESDAGAGDEPAGEDGEQPEPIDVKPRTKGKTSGEQGQETESKEKHEQRRFGLRRGRR